MVSDSIIETNNLSGHLSIPDKKSGKGVLLVHAWWGLNEFFKDLANRFAVEGFVTFAPDYYDGRVATTINEANNLSTELDRKKADTTVTSALKYLKQHPSVIGKRFGVLGVSLGTLFAVDLARSRPEDVGVIILFYGLGDGEFNSIKTPVQGHFAEVDDWDADSKAVKKVEAQLSESDGVYEFYTYQGTSHWFLEEDVTEAYHQPSAELAFRRTITFLKLHL